MKIFLSLLLLAFFYCGCERHSAEETAPFHEKHGHHEKEDSAPGHDVTATEKPAHVPAQGEHAEPKAGH